MTLFKAILFIKIINYHLYDMLFKLVYAIYAILGTVNNVII